MKHRDLWAWARAHWRVLGCVCTCGYAKGGSAQQRCTTRSRWYTLRRWGVTWCYIGHSARDMCEQTASAVRCSMVLHRAFREGIDCDSEPTDTETVTMYLSLSLYIYIYTYIYTYAANVPPGARGAGALRIESMSVWPSVLSNITINL